MGNRNLEVEAKEKALCLVDIFSNYTFKHESKQCAMVAVREIINANPHSNPLNTEVESTMLFWNEVKREIEKL
jgi:hypothetical protein